ncbi:cardiolipin synthase [Arthrobacter sp. KK5.5]|uniref:cardiolipin synthase n=1 Tax=Arthrobacter sp. KK5.5 TaxID=3373084 RepID=UPI003EE7198B
MFDALALWESLPAWLLVTAWVIDAGIRLVMIGIVPGNRRPTTAMAWLLTIFFMPVVGLVLFLLLGNFRLSERRIQRQKDVNDRVLAATQHLDIDDSEFDAPDWVRSAVELNRNLGAFPMQEGNALEFITGYRASLEAMTAAVNDAERYVHVQFYIVGDDPEFAGPLLDALDAASARGVKVRFLFDHLGTARIKGFPKLKKRLNDAGIEWRAMLPVSLQRRRWRRPDLRNHRKILVIDGEVAFTGSQNLIEPGYKRASAHAAGREWVDLMARVRGPLVTGLDVVFATDWSQETDENLMEDLTRVVPEVPRGSITGQIVPSGPGFKLENNLRLFTTLIYSATEKLTITSPYFVPDDSLLYAVTTAAQRGVDVELFVSETGDQMLVHHAQQSYYKQLLSAGVKIYRYPAPMVLHSKCFTVDDEVAVFGSSNMDMRSFSLNLEVSVMLIGAEAVAEVTQVQDVYRAASRLLTLEEWEARPPLARWADNAARLTATLQ